MFGVENTATNFTAVVLHFPAALPLLRLQHVMLFWINTSDGNSFCNQSDAAVPLPRLRRHPTIMQGHVGVQDVNAKLLA